MKSTSRDVSRQVLDQLRDGGSDADVEELEEGAEQIPGSRTREEADAGEETNDRQASNRQKPTDNSRGTANDGQKKPDDRSADTNQQPSNTEQPVEAKSLGSETLDGLFGKTEAGTDANLAGDAANLAGKTPIALSGDQLITVEGRTMKFSEYQAFGKPKAEFDRERQSFSARARDIERDSKIVEAILPHVEAVQNNPYLRTYTDTYLAEKASGKSEEEANEIAEVTAAARVGRAQHPAQGRRAAVDPRLVPPADEDGKPLPADDPRMIDWRTSDDRITALAEQQASKLVNTREAERQRREDEQRQRTDAAQKVVDDERKFRDDVFGRNKATMAQLPDILRSRGVDLSKVPKHVFLEAVGQMVDKAALPVERGGYGKDLRSDDFLRGVLLQPGDMAQFIDASGIVERLRINPAGATKTENGAGTNGDANTNGHDSRSNGEGKLRTARSQGKRPLDAGGPSENLPGYREEDLAGQGEPGWKGAYDELH